jgi:hypothetical protein
MQGKQMPEMRENNVKGGFLPSSVIPEKSKIRGKIDFF